MKKKTLGLLTTLICLSLNLLTAHAEPSTDAARGVLSRVLGQQAAENINLKKLPTKEKTDYYFYQAKEGQLQVAGTSTVAMCRAVYDYLRKHNLGTIGWAGPRLELPKKWPDSPLTKNTTPFQIRQSYNVVTFGYTTPFWTWQRWQQELDWQAMHGYNMVLAPVATEAIASRVWKKIGLTQAEIDAFYTGPAHLPWQRMGNIQAVGGSLSQAWHEDQISLQKKILKRLRELDIEPVIQGFAGFVPKGLKRIHPDLPMQATFWTGGFQNHQHPHIILPDDPRFASIMKAYLNEWQQEFGPVSHVLIDSFNEMNLPTAGSKARELLSGYGQNTYQALKAAIPHATWVLQGWMFSYQRHIWTPEALAALLEKVPNDKLLILDYAHDYKPGWDHFSAFHGKKWALGYVPNMGGKTALVGRLPFYASQAAKVLASRKKGNLVGLTMSGEGLENNEIVYELVTDTAWNDKPIDLKKWLPSYVANRYGVNSPALQKAWQELSESVYRSFTDHPHYGWQRGKLDRGTAYHDPKMIAAIRKFLSAAHNFADQRNITDDATEMAALALSQRADAWLIAAREAATVGRISDSKKAGHRAIELLLEADRLLASHSYLRLDHWIQLARSHQGSPAERDAYERSARQILTIWGPPINDYSCRVWSGLIRDFYAPRIQQILNSEWTGQPFNRGQWEAHWVNATGISSITPFENPVLSAHQLVEKAFNETVPTFAPKTEDAIAHWSPAQMSTEWKTQRWEIPAATLNQLQGLTFLYTRGAHLLEIRNVKILADGQSVAEDSHFGSTGLEHKNNFYTLKLPKKISANNSCEIVAEIRSKGGTDSHGQILLAH